MKKSEYPSLLGTFPIQENVEDSQGEADALDPARQQADLTDDDHLEARDGFWSIFLRLYLSSSLSRRR